MPNQRSPKRQRKKEAAAARREAMAEVAKRRRRQRLAVLAATLAALIGAGVAVAVLASRDDSTPLADPDDPALASPDASDGPTATLAPVACDADVPETANTKKPSYDEPADQGLDASKTWLLRLETSCGRIDIALDVERAPETANSVAFLASKGFYDGLVFHRVVPGFVLQGGDPLGADPDTSKRGTGGPGYKVTEAPPENLDYDLGIVAMAKGGAEAPGTSGSQFFIVSGDEAEALPAEFALVGKVAGGMDVVDTIDALGRADGVPAPRETVYIENATVVAG